MTVLLTTLKWKDTFKRRVPVDGLTMKMLRQYIEAYKIRGKIFNITRQRAFQILRVVGKKAGIENVGTKGPVAGHNIRIMNLK